MSKIIRTFPPHDRQRYGEWYCCPVDVEESGEVYLKKMRCLTKSRRNQHTGETTLVSTLTHLPFVAYGRLDKLTGKHEVEYYRIMPEGTLLRVEQEEVNKAMEYLNGMAVLATKETRGYSDLVMRILMKRRGYKCVKIGGEDS